MSTTPAGWYPQADGSQRYWDGEKWTEHVAPGSVQEAPAGDPGVAAASTVTGAEQTAPGEPGGGGGPLGLVKRHKVVSGVVGGVLLLTMVGALSGGGDDTSVSTVAGVEASRATTTPSSSPVGRTAESAPTPTPTPTPTKTKQPAPTKAAEPAGTAAQMNALRSAEDYLSFKGFSKAGLIDQLSSEYGDGYAKADAKWAVDHLDVNWNEQAVRVARDYLDMKGFSRKGLIDQLSSAYGEQFTVKQATYAADKLGL